MKSWVGEETPKGREYSRDPVRKKIKFLLGFLKIIMTILVYTQTATLKAENIRKPRISITFMSLHMLIIKLKAENSTAVCEVSFVSAIQLLS